MHVGETPREEGQNNDGLDSGSIVGIIIACLVAALLILILIIVSVIAVFREHKKRTGKAEFISKRYKLTMCTQVTIIQYLCSYIRIYVTVIGLESFSDF